MLSDAVSMNPQITQLTLQGLQAQLAGVHRQGLQDIGNQLSANNQDTSSTANSAYGNFETDYQNQLVNAGAQAGIADINRALSNRVSLFGTGLNAIQSSGQGAQTASNAQNSFNLENYQNQVAKTLAEQKQQTGGLVGGLLGGGAGGALGLLALTNPATAPFALGIGLGGAAIGGTAGALGPVGTGGALFQAGSGLAGSRLGNNYSPSQAPVYSAGATTPESISGGLSNYRNSPYYPY